MALQGVTRFFRRLLAATCAVLLGAPLAWGWTSSSSAFGVTIRVEGEGWGRAEREEIETLLYAVADELVDGPAPVFAHAIVVTQGGDAPVALFERGLAGEHRIRLSARDRAWAQYAYQFGHELCHIMANHGVHAHDPVRRRHQWFEEALCEAAGLYVLRSMAVRWRDRAPSPAWEDYAPVLGDYAARLAGEPHRRLAAGQTPADWLRTRIHALGDDPYRRDDNEVLANLLLAHFEQTPEHWAALYALNRSDSMPVRDFRDHLRQWHDAAPASHRPFIARLAALLVRTDADFAVKPSAQLAASVTATRAN